MARPSNASILAGMKRELARSRRWRKHEDFDALWRRMVDLYRGRHYNDKLKTDRIVVNMAFATINVIAPSIAVNNPKIVLNARQPESAATAIIGTEVINYEWRRGKFQREFRAATNDKLMIGHGWLKVGYKYATSDVPAVQPEDDNVTEPAVTGEQDETDPSVEVQQVVTEDRPILERVAFEDMFVDPDAHNPKELRWIAQRITRPIADAKADKTYDVKARRALQAGLPSKWDQDEQPAHGQAPDPTKDGYVVIWEFWDCMTGKVATFADNAEEGMFLRAPRKSAYPFNHPYLMLRNYEVPGEFYPMGELEAVEVLQRELNETRTQMLNHRKKFSRKWLYRKSAFEKEGVDALRSDADNTMVPVVADVPLGDVIVNMPAAITPPEFYNQSTMIQDDINMVTATSDYMRGGMPDMKRTATEASLIQDNANARAADKLAVVEDELSEIAEKLLKVLQTFVTGEHVIRIVGQDGLAAWGHWDRDFIKGEFDFEVEAGSTQPQNETQRRQSAMQMIDALAPFAAVLNMPELAAHILQEGFGVKNPQRFIMAPAPQEGPPQGADPNAPTPGGEALAGMMG